MISGQQIKFLSWVGSFHRDVWSALTIAPTEHITLSEISTLKNFLEMSVKKYLQ